MATLPNQNVGIGHRPALIVVDATVGFTDPESPLGTESTREVAAIAKLLQVFRHKRLPVVFTTNSYLHAAEASVFREKVPLLNQLVAGGPLAAIDPRILPQQDEIVLNKGVPSAFFDSPLRQMLNNLGVDSTVIVGFTTSGCVRATAVDALQSNFRLVVVREACGDRDPQAHEANLRDLQLKYGDVVSLEDALQMIGDLPR
ncbi:MAG: isochorismatase family protein [Proteobacteria bacterium]|nr:isochorismatase family protein [Pseudomonadota bacterium]